MLDGMRLTDREASEIDFSDFDKEELARGFLTSALVERIADAQIKKAVLWAIEKLLDGLTSEERVGVFLKYCVSCGKKGSDCQCWNEM